MLSSFYENILKSPSEVLTEKSTWWSEFMYRWKQKMTLFLTLCFSRDTNRLRCKQSWQYYNIPYLYTGTDVLFNLPISSSLSVLLLIFLKKYIYIYFFKRLQLVYKYKIGVKSLNTILNLKMYYARYVYVVRYGQWWPKCCMSTFGIFLILYSHKLCIINLENYYFKIWNDRTIPRNKVFDFYEDINRFYRTCKIFNIYCQYVCASCHVGYIYVCMFLSLCVCMCCVCVCVCV